MRKNFNFSAGPAVLPEEVLLQAQKEMLDWNGTGVSIMELGHRGSEFKTIVEESEANLRELMNIPKNYRVLFISGGATHQFSMVPLNLYSAKKEADYIETGVWSKKAAAEAKHFGEVNVAAEVIKENGLFTVPPQSKWSLNPNADYVHYTPNETVEGIEFQWVPQTGKVPLVADMTSFILSRPVDVNQFGIIYAGAQKNMGQAGISVVIIRDDLIKDPIPGTPILYSYQITAEHHSLYNTPPTYSWYILNLVLRWMKQNGGVKKFAERNERRAMKLYQIIDKSKGFYLNTVHPDYRSWMNVVFNLETPELTQLFLDEAKKIGLKYLKGHRLVGGVRASLYNAMPDEGVNQLAEFMEEFAKRY